MAREAVTFYADEDDAAWLRSYAERQRVPMSVYLRQALGMLRRLAEAREDQDRKKGHRKGKPPKVWSQAEDRHNKGVG